MGDRLRTKAAAIAINNILLPYRNLGNVNSSRVCGKDVQRLHREFQFQYATVEGTLGQKFWQYLDRSVSRYGIPDELTMILGSFDIYAAVGQTYFHRESWGTVATITHVNIYVRDGFTFTDDNKDVSQYLGHWNSESIAIVPVSEIAVLANRRWIDFPVMPRPTLKVKKLLYPVKNSDFRAWQIKHKQGGDFMIYTDPVSVRLDRPISVIISGNNDVG